MKSGPSKARSDGRGAVLGINEWCCHRGRGWGCVLPVGTSPAEWMAGCTARASMLGVWSSDLGLGMSRFWDLWNFDLTSLSLILPHLKNEDPKRSQDLLNSEIR